MIWLPYLESADKWDFFQPWPRTSKSEMNQWNNRVQLLYNHIPSYVGIHQAFKTSRSPVSFLGIVSVCVFFTNIGRTFLRDSWNKRRTGIEQVLTHLLLIVSSIPGTWPSQFGGAKNNTTNNPTKNNATATNHPANNQPRTSSISVILILLFLRGFHLNPRFLLPQIAIPLHHSGIAISPVHRMRLWNCWQECKAWQLGGSKMWVLGWIGWNYPPTSHHQDYEPFLVGNRYNINLHLWLLLG